MALALSPRQAAPSSAAPPSPPLLVLRRALLWRLGAAAGVVVLGLACADWHVWRQRTAAELPATAALVSQLINDDLARHASPFSRMVAHVNLAPLAHLAQRVPFCAEVQDLASHQINAACLPATEADDGWGSRTARWLAEGAGAGLQISGPLMLPAGVKAGLITVQPHWQIEGRTLVQHALILLAAGAALMAVLLMASRLVARALAPANQVLLALKRLAQGDQAVRLPPMALAELHHIGEGFNRLAEAVSATERQQQQLAEHLLQAREAERRRLARELHDEMGQSLTALQAEAAAMRLMTTRLTQAAQSAQAMCDTTAQLLDGLQRVLADLRPQALDEFGLPVALRSLTRSPQRRSDGGALQVHLSLPEPWPALPPGHDIHVYRIVQEALTNARRHSQAGSVWVQVARDDERLTLQVRDDGPHEPVSTLAPGHGLLGLQERVQALGGQVRWHDGAGGGLGLSASWPLRTLSADLAHPAGAA